MRHRSAAKTISARRLAFYMVLAAAACWAARPACGQIMQMPPSDAVDQADPDAATPPYYFPVQRLPSLDGPPDAAAVATASAPGAGSDGATSPATDLTRGARPGVFQKLLFEGTWLPRTGQNGFAFDTLELKMVLGLPCPTREFPMLITPGFAVHYLDGPAAVALPPQLYDAYVEFRWLGHVTPRLGLDVAVTPGEASDFRQDDSQALRITGHGIAAWTWTPTLTLVLGADYLDRTDVPLLPVAGLVWTPNDDTKFALVFPQPKISRRVYWCGATNQDVQDWVYIGGELGGGTWAIRRSDGADDVLNYRDLRAFLGIERRAIGRINPRLEIGYVFARKLQLDQAAADYFPRDTLMLRGALAY
jgi:hypothetical protein